MIEETIMVKEPEQEQGPSKSSAQKRTETKDKPMEPVAEKMRRILLRHPKAMVVGWCIVVLAFLISIPAAYFCWYFLPPHLWKWANEVWWHWIPSFFGFLCLFGIPIWAVMGALSLTGFVTEVSLSIEDAAVHKHQQAVRETEDEAIGRLEETDKEGLLPLLKYSRVQLHAYYEIGLRQTRGSFFNSVLAMWLGFILLLVGVAMYVGPVEKIGLKVPGQDFRILVMGGGVIIEFISVLFLWVYRSSKAQLTHFYNRQMNAHTSILCFRIASTMEKAKADDTRGAIVNKVLDWTSTPERQPIVGAKGLSYLLGSGGSKAVS